MIDCDAEPDLARRFKVKSLPTFMLYKDETVLSSLQGMRTKEELKNVVLGKTIDNGEKGERLQ